MPTNFGESHLNNFDIPKISTCEGVLVQNFKAIGEEANSYFKLSQYYPIVYAKKTGNKLLLSIMLLEN